MITDGFLRWYLPLFVIVYLLVSFVLPSWRVYCQTGIYPVKFGKRNNAHDYIGFLMKATTALLVAAVLFFSFGKETYQYTVPVWYLESESVRMTGFVLLHLSLVWIAIAQYQMRTSWRIGIDEENRTPLVTGGVFSWSRNPVFLGMMASLASIFLIIPNAVTLLILGTSYCLVQIQIRLEEAFLMRNHREVYREYRDRVRRFI